jgi:hypothetical protein
MEETNFFLNIWESRDVILVAVLGVVGAASAIVGGTNTPDPDTLLGKIYKIVEWASLTFGKAKQ